MMCTVEKLKTDRKRGVVNKKGWLAMGSNRDGNDLVSNEKQRKNNVLRQQVQAPLRLPFLNLDRDV